MHSLYFEFRIQLCKLEILKYVLYHLLSKGMTVLPDTVYNDIWSCIISICFYIDLKSNIPEYKWDNNIPTIPVMAKHCTCNHNWKSFFLQINRTFQMYKIWNKSKIKYSDNNNIYNKYPFPLYICFAKTS